MSPITYRAERRDHVTGLLVLAAGIASFAVLAYLWRSFEQMALVIGALHGLPLVVLAGYLVFGGGLRRPWRATAFALVAQFALMAFVLGPVDDEEWAFLLVLLITPPGALAIASFAGSVPGGGRRRPRVARAQAGSPQDRCLRG